MTSKLCKCLSLQPFVLLLVLVACQKTEHVEDQATQTNATVTLLNTTSRISCPYAPDYGDSILYLQPGDDNYSVAPINNINEKGKYLSWPEGLKINPSSGIINLAKSETGIRYNIGFIKKGTNDTCVSQVIIGGISYIDSIYVLQKDDTLVSPIFNANPNALPVCDASDDSDYPDNNGNGNAKCSFDEDVPGSKANDQKLRVRTKSGAINLKKSMADGLFGRNPKNGDSKKIKIMYSLNDKSKKAKQKLTVQVMYYNNVSSIPSALYSEVQMKREAQLDYHVVNGKPRPPLLIIAGFAN